MTQWGTTAQRFWSRVDASGGIDACWPWTGYRNEHGYGTLSRAGQRAAKAHRVSLELAGVDVPPGLLVLHGCDNPACVNPAHLRLGTHSDNRRDMYARGRRPVSAPRTHCKRGHAMTPENVLPNGRKRRCRTCRRLTEQGRGRTKQAAEKRPWDQPTSLG